MESDIRGSDGDDLKTLSDQIDGIVAGGGMTVSAFANGAEAQINSIDTATDESRKVLANPIRYDFASTPARMLIRNPSDTANIITFDVFKEDGIGKPLITAEIAIRRNKVIV